MLRVLDFACFMIQFDINARFSIPIETHCLPSGTNSGRQAIATLCLSGYMLRRLGPLVIKPNRLKMDYSSISLVYSPFLFYNKLACS